MEVDAAALEHQAGPAERVAGDFAVLEDERCAGWPVGVEAVVEAAAARAAARAANHWFCDPRLDADVRRARRLEGTDLRAANALFTKLDREVTDRAIFLPLVNPYYYDFVSARVKNYVGDPRFGLNVDQASLR